MKIIEYRIYDKRNKSMIYFTFGEMMESILSTEYVYYYIPDNILNAADYFERNDFTDVMQNTGKSDMNGKHIYEGDIIRKECCVPDDPAYRYYGVSGIVRESYDDMGWRIQPIDDCDDSFYDNMGMNFTFEEISIIGNKYENPDLIT